MVAVGVFVSVASPAAAQRPEQPIGRFVADARVAFPKLGAEPGVATGLGVPVSSLPGRGLGIDADAHWYPVRTRLITFGLGAGVLLSRGRQAPAGGTPVETRFSAVPPQISLNFGHRQGWSYLSGGMWQAKITHAIGDGVPAPETPAAKTINYGGGARWFTNDHLAVSIDVRFYAINPQLDAPPVPARPRLTLLVISIGAAFR